MWEMISLLGLAASRSSWIKGLTARPYFEMLAAPDETTTWNVICIDSALDCYSTLEGILAVVQCNNTTEQNLKAQCMYCPCPH